MKLNKLFAGVLAAAMMMSVGVSAMAAKDNQNASFTKTYKITNEGTSNPEETFNFTFTADHVTDSNKNLTTEQMPAIGNATVEYTEGTATVEGLERTVGVALSNVTWPGVGVYYYQVKEVAGNTAGVVYDSNTAWLKVTVAYDEGTQTYYTAFVTLSLTDEDGNGITDNKTGGFTNEYQAGSLAITKNVTGNLGDRTAYFAVKVTLNGETGKTYADTYAVSGGSYSTNPTTIAIGTETTFYLKDNDTITISNLPYNVTYTVVEEDYTTDEKGKYDEASYNFSDSEKKIDSASDTVTITNNKGTVVDTGVILDNAPYIVMLAVVAGGAFFMISKKRREE